jgi:putative FmdB family regulatory protein
MPLWEYECRDCGTRVEVLQGLDEEGPEHCPKCKGKLRRLLSVPGLIFKGSGFYVNDYADKDTVAQRSKGEKELAASTGDSEPTKEAAEAAKDATVEGRKSKVESQKSEVADPQSAIHDNEA